MTMTRTLSLPWPIGAESDNRVWARIDQAYWRRYGLG